MRCLNRGVVHVVSVVVTFYFIIFIPVSRSPHPGNRIDNKKRRKSKAPTPAPSLHFGGAKCCGNPKPSLIGGRSASRRRRERSPPIKPPPKPRQETPMRIGTQPLCAPRFEAGAVSCAAFSTLIVNLVFKKLIID